VWEKRRGGESIQSFSNPPNPNPNNKLKIVFGPTSKIKRKIAKILSEETEMKRSQRREKKEDWSSSSLPS
jgi:hypothetical protein